MIAAHSHGNARSWEAGIGLGRITERFKLSSPIEGKCKQDTINVVYAVLPVSKPTAALPAGVKTNGRIACRQGAHYNVHLGWKGPCTF